MFPSRTIPVLLLFAIGACHNAGTTDPCIENTLEEEQDKALLQRKANLQDTRQRIVHFHDRYSGTVIAIGVDWFELAAGWECDKDVAKLATTDTSKSKRFYVVFAILGEKPNLEPDIVGFPSAVCGAPTHRFCDLKVGDWVALDNAREKDGIEWVLQLNIVRRPGGKIPPWYGDLRVNSERAYHLYYQAHQDWEEKGTPIPKIHCDPDGRAPWTNPPYPPVAPAPRVRGAKP
jgi:hypothetical protein